MLSSGPAVMENDKQGAAREVKVTNDQLSEIPSDTRQEAEMEITPETEEKQKPKQTDKHPVMYLNELIQGLKYDLISEVTKDKVKEFTIGVNVKGIVFEGTGNNKKSAKMAAAQLALLEIFNTEYCTGKCHQRWLLLSQPC